MKSNRFLHSNELPYKRFLISCKTTSLRAVENWAYSVFKVNILAKNNSIILKMIFVLEYQTRKETFFGSWIFINLGNCMYIRKKVVPIFIGGLGSFTNIFLSSTASIFNFGVCLHSNQTKGRSYMTSDGRGFSQI